MVKQDNTHDYSVGKLHPLSKRADCRSKCSKRQITCTCMENTAESYCAETNLKGYFLKWFPVHFRRLRLRTMRRNENCARKAQVANTKFACRKSAMKKFAPQLRTCSFADYLSQTPSTGCSTLIRFIVGVLCVFFILCVLIFEAKYECIIIKFILK